MPGTLGSTKTNEWRLVARRFGRMAVAGISVGIADESSYAVAVAENISQGGLKLAGLSPRFQADKFLYRAVVSTDGKSFRLTVKPCWRRSDNGQSVEIGFKVIEAPWEWYEFTDPQISQIF